MNPQLMQILEKLLGAGGSNSMSQPQMGQPGVKPQQAGGGGMSPLGMLLGGMKGGMSGIGNAMSGMSPAAGMGPAMGLGQAMKGIGSSALGGAEAGASAGGLGGILKLLAGL